MLALFRTLFSPPRDLLLVLAATWVGLALAEKNARRYLLDIQAWNNLTFFPLLAYLIGGRLLYALEHLSAFVQSPLSLISLNLSLFDAWGALAAALLTGLVYAQQHRLLHGRALDALTPLLACLAVGIGLSHLASGQAFGRETTAAWAIDLWGAKRHPAQVYEIIASLLTLGLLQIQTAEAQPGARFLSFTALTSAWRLVLEAFRGDSLLILGGLRAAQIAAWLVLAASLAALELLRLRASQATPDHNASK